MSRVVIRAENISKAYQLGEFSTGTLSRDLDRWMKKLRGKEDPYLKIGEENDRRSKTTRGVVWSLKDINFDIQQGEAVGIIGRNGAGKSTLLKILSRVTTPTTGNIKIKGRIASLLEVGTGFHPELTGRENIFLNGAILGMRKQEIKRKFDEITEFSGVEKYIDTPVKRYSSGMYVRLAFAVAAHLDSEILIVDEVLAVGDAEFQKKCLGKMGEVSKGEGRTVLFVSHNLGSISQLCNSAILLKNGRIASTGKTDRVVSEYLSTAVDEQPKQDLSFDHLEHYIARISTCDATGKAKKQFGTNEEIFLEIDIVSKSYLQSLEIGVVLFDKREQRVFTIHRGIYEQILRKDQHSRTWKLKFDPNYLTPGFYSWTVTMHIPHQVSFHLLQGASRFEVYDAGSELASYEGSDIGFVFPRFQVVE